MKIFNEEIIEYASASWYTKFRLLFKRMNVSIDTAFGYGNSTGGIVYWKLLNNKIYIYAKRSRNRY